MSTTQSPFSREWRYSMMRLSASCTMHLRLSSSEMPARVRSEVMATTSTGTGPAWRSMAPMYSRTASCWELRTTVGLVVTVSVP